MVDEVQTALDVLRRHPGLHVQAAETAGLDLRHAGLFISVTSRAGTAEYVAEYKRSVTTTTLPHILSQLEALRQTVDLPPLLLAPYLTPAATRRLIEERIEFADAAGNVYIDGPAAYICVLGQKRRSERTDFGLTATDLQLIFAYIARPELLDATYRELSARTGVSLGKISGTVKKLESLGHMSRPKSGIRLLRNPESLLERWEFGYLEQLRPTLHPTGWRIGPSSKLSKVRNHAETLDGVLIGGEHAADTITRYLTPGTLTLHVPRGKVLAVANELHLARGGSAPDVTTLERFVPNEQGDGGYTIDTHPEHAESGLVHPILVRAELLALDDARLRNVAERLLSESILPGLHHDVA